MIWNENNNKKWTTKYCSEENWTFFDTEISSPTRSKCVKNNSNPDLFITVNNQNLTENKSIEINQAVTINIGNHLIHEADLKDIEENIIELAKLLNAKFLGKLERPAAYKNDINLGYTDSFWLGPYGVLNSDDRDFSDNYKGYGIKNLMENSIHNNK